MPNFTALLVLSAITIANIGEGFTSAEAGAKINAGYRMFTTITGPERCDSTLVPASIVAEPINLVVGDTLELTDLVVAAYSASGDFIPSVPIEILEQDTANRILIRDLESTRYVYVAKDRGMKTLLIRHYCQGEAGATAELQVTIRRVAT